MLYLMMSIEQKAEECDATEDDGNPEAGNTKQLTIKELMQE